MGADAADGRRVVGLIPARGGSKGVPGKNIRPLGGRPLIEWSIASALAARTVAVVVVSTDSSEIAAVSRSAGAEVPFMRLSHLASDAAPTLPVIIDALDRLVATYGHFDAVCLLQPTSPFRIPGLIDDAVNHLFDSRADSVVSVTAVPTEHHPDWVLLRDDDGFMRWATGRSEPPSRRQDLSPAFHRDGSVYVTRTSVLRSCSLFGSRIGAIEVAGPVVNIDTAGDWERAERLVGGSGGSRR